jgi:hypothetical protein
MEEIKVFYSYSSALSPVEFKDILNIYSKYTPNILLSLYDINYYLKEEGPFMRKILSEKQAIFFDSGIYEVESYNRFNINSHEWGISEYYETLWRVLGEINLNKNIYISNYDNRTLNLSEQLDESIKTFTDIEKDFSSLGIDYVFTLHGNPIEIAGLLKARKSDITERFDNFVIAVPEKELGNNILEKIKNLRYLLLLNFPIHLLGCLDPKFLIIFSIMGVGYFDGLNWLKFYFNNKVAYYRNLYELDLINDKVLDSRSYVINNCIYLENLISDIEYSIISQDYSGFEDEKMILDRILISEGD